MVSILNLKMLDSNILIFEGWYNRIKYYFPTSISYSMNNCVWCKSGCGGCGGCGGGREGCCGCSSCRSCE